MATAAQRKANRQNAAYSTGPKTAEGKQRSSGNAVTYGLFCRDMILPGESPRRFLVMREGLIASYLPQSLAELMLVERMANAQWKLNRLQLAYAQLHGSLVEELRCKFAKQLQIVEEEDEDDEDEEEEQGLSGWSKEKLQEQIKQLESGKNPELGGSLLYWLKAEETERLSRQEQRLENSLFRAGRELERLQKHRRASAKDEEISSPFLSDIRRFQEELEEAEPNEDEKMKNEANLEESEDKPQEEQKLAEPTAEHLEPRAVPGSAATVTHDRAMPQSDPLKGRPDAP